MSVTPTGKTPPQTPATDSATAASATAASAPAASATPATATVTSLSCSAVAGVLSRLVDGELGREEAADVHRHLEACGRCRGEHAELEHLLRGLRALPPPQLSDERAASLWDRLDERIARGPLYGPLYEPLLARLVSSLRRRWFVAGAGLALAGVAAAALLVLPARHHVAALSVADEGALWQDAEREFRSAEQHYQRAVADLGRLAQRERQSWPEEQRARFDAALASLERATAARHDAARASDPVGEEALYRAYRDEITYLEDALLRGGPR